MKKSAWIVIAAVLLFSWGTVSSALADQVVQIPYGVSVGGWSTGVAITNLSSSATNDLMLDIVKQNGLQHSFLSQYRTNLGALDAYAMTVDFLNTLYGKALPDSRFWCEIWHSGTEKFAVTVFVMNITTGQAEGFGFYPFFSTSKAHTFSTYTPPMVVEK